MNLVIPGLDIIVPFSGTNSLFSEVGVYFWLRFWFIPAFSPSMLRPYVFKRSSHRCSLSCKPTSAVRLRRRGGAGLLGIHSAPDFTQLRHGSLRSHLTLRWLQSTQEFFLILTVGAFAASGVGSILWKCKINSIDHGRVFKSAPRAS